MLIEVQHRSAMPVRSRHGPLPIGGCRQVLSVSRGRVLVGGLMAIRSRRVAAAVLTTVFGSGIVMAPASTLATSLPSMLFAFESSGTYVGQPEVVTETGATASMIFHGLAASDPRISVSVYAATETWTITIDPPDGEQLAVGVYEEAAGQDPDHAELRVSRFGSGCGAVSTDSLFEVHELTRDASGAPTSLAMSFRYSCQDDFGVMVGRLRLNSTLPLPSLSPPHASRYFGAVAVGAGLPRSFTIGANGDLAVPVTNITVGGEHDSDFLLDDNCSGSTLTVGSTCDFEIEFAPTATGDRLGSVTIEYAAPASPQTLPLIGDGLTSTTGSVSVEPETTYFDPGMLYVGTVTPNPGGGLADMWIDGEAVQGVVSPQGRLTVAKPRTSGPHTAQLHFLGTDTHAESWSTEFSFAVSSTTTTGLTPGPTSISAGTPITFDATVTTGGELLYSGGTLTIRDLSTGQDIVSEAVDNTDPSVSVTVSLAPGSHDIRARYSGIDGLLDASSTTHSITVVRDTVAPTATAPSRRLLTGTSISAGKTVVRLWWTGSDVLSGIARYELEQSTDSGAWTTVSTALTSATLDRPLAPQHTYRFRVRAVDNADNVGAWATGSSFGLTRYSETNSRIRYSGTWTLARSSVYWGGQAKRSSSTGAKASITVTARTVEWVARKGPTYGKAQVYVNGVLKATVDLYASTYQNQRVAWSYTWSSSTSRTITIKVLGTSGRPRVDLDAIVAAN
jgi:hypothetical protein